MYGPPGIAYVYLVYGMYECLNVVTEPVGRPAAVLIRAVEPLEGAELMRQARVARTRRRGPPDAERAAAREATPEAARDREVARLADLPEARLAAGPGLVAAAFDITRAETGLDLLDPASPLRLERGIPPSEVVATPRVGIGYAAEPWRTTPWRLVDPASPAVSGPRRRG